MKSNEILQALSLTKNRQTTDYCSKLANVFTFIKTIQQDIINAVIVGTGYTINCNGKILDTCQIEKDYKASLLNHYRYNDKEILELTSEESSKRSQLYKVNELLWKKRKNKDNSVLEGERDQLQADIKTIDTSKEILISLEDTRLQTIKADVSEMRKELNLFTACKIAVEIQSGSYCFYIPVDNTFYYEVLRMLNIAFEVAKVESIPAKYQFFTYPELMDNIKKAAAFTSDDDLRPAMQSICLDFSSEGIQVVSTDAHRLYYSKRISFDGCKEDMKLLIDETSVKAICKAKVNYNEVLTITVFADNTATFNDVKVRLFTEGRYPQYEVVIPKYSKFMEFDRKRLIENVNKVKVYANKTTQQVTFHINGSIALHAQDVDFSFEGDADMPYITKQFPDTDIAFNGNFLNQCLGTFKDKTVKMLTDGISTKAALFTNDVDTVLLMPLMINC